MTGLAGGHSSREAGEEICSLLLPALLRSPSLARRQVTAALQAWESGPDTIQVAELLVSELVTNSIKISGHGPMGDCGAAGVDRISVTVQLLPGRVLIEVFDNDQNPPVLADAGADAENGRGLILVQALSKEWGYYFPPACGKTVFAVISAPEHERTGLTATGGAGR